MVMTGSPRQATAKNLHDIATDAIGSLIQQVLDDEGHYDGIQERYDLTDDELAKVLKELKKLQKKIDPFGRWDEQG